MNSKNFYESIGGSYEDVIRNCIYGIDKNPQAVKLCKVALWLESHNPGTSLGFLDNHIKCGDTLVGVARVEDIFKTIPSDTFKTYKDSDKKHADYTSYYEGGSNLGDVNQDGKITVTDVMVLVKMILAQ